MPEELSRCLKVTVPFLNIRSKTTHHDCQGKPSLSPAGHRRFFCQSLKGVNDGCRNVFCIIILNLTAPYFCHINSWHRKTLLCLILTSLWDRKTIHASHSRPLYPQLKEQQVLPPEEPKANVKNKSTMQTDPSLPHRLINSCYTNASIRD